MTGKWLLGEALDWKTQFSLSVSFALVLGLSLTLPNVCAVGEHGDVSALLRTAWTLATGSATLVSFVLAVRKYRAETSRTAPDDESTDSNTAIHVESVEGDVDLNVTLGDERDEGRTARSVRRAGDGSEATDGSDRESGDSSEPSEE